MMVLISSLASVLDCWYAMAEFMLYGRPSKGFWSLVSYTTILCRMAVDQLETS
jgi:hypothetical protein